MASFSLTSFLKPSFGLAENSTIGEEGKGLAESSLMWEEVFISLTSTYDCSFVN